MSVDVTSLEAKVRTENETIENATETTFFQSITQWFRTKLAFLNLSAEESSKSNRKTETSKEELPPQQLLPQHNEPDLR